MVIMLKILVTFIYLFCCMSNARPQEQWSSSDGYKFISYTAEYNNYFATPMINSLIPFISKEIKGFFSKNVVKKDKKLKGKQPIKLISEINRSISDKDYNKIPEIVEKIEKLSPEQERLGNDKINSHYQKLKQQLLKLDNYYAKFAKTFYALSLPHCWLVFEPDAKIPAGGACVSLDPNNLSIYLDYGFGTTKAKEHLKEWLLHITPWAREVHDRNFESTSLNTFCAEELGAILLPSLVDLRFEVSLSTLVKEIIPQVEEEVLEQPIFTLGRFLKEIPDKGFKLHVSGTKQSASIIFQLVKPLLDRFGISYKVCSAEDFLDVLAQSHQKGKLLTIYPRNDDEAVKIAHHLDQIFLYAIERGLFNSLSFPSISTDKALGQSGAVYYRYGTFRNKLPHDDNMYEKTDDGSVRFRLNDDEYSKNKWPSNEPDWRKWDGITPKTEAPTQPKKKPKILERVQSKAIEFLVAQLVKSQTEDSSAIPMQEVSVLELSEDGIEVYLKYYQGVQSRIVQGAVQDFQSKYTEISSSVFNQSQHYFSPFQRTIESLARSNLGLFWTDFLNAGSNTIHFDPEKYKTVCEKGYREETSALDTVVNALMMSAGSVEKDLRTLLKKSHFLVLKGPSNEILLCIPFERIDDKVNIRPRRGDFNRYGEKIRQFFFRELIDQIDSEEIEISLLQKALAVANQTTFSLEY